MAAIRYADEFQPKFGLPYPRFSPEEAEKFTPEDLSQLKALDDFVTGASPGDPTMYGWTLEGWREVMENWSKYQVHVILGGNRCVRGDTPIYDPVLGVSRPISSIKGSHHVQAWDGENVVTAEAPEPFTKGVSKMLRVSLSSGDSFVSTYAHRVMLDDGEWSDVSGLKIGTLLKGGLTVTGLDYAGTEVVWDIQVPVYLNYVAAGVIHHNSSKSSFMARLLVHLAITIPEARLRAFHVNDEKSIGEQQAAVWEALPASIKALGKKKNQAYSVQYSQKNGFTGGKLILPAQPGCARGSEIIFHTYAAYKNDNQMAEGWWAHAIALDEEAPQKLFETLRYRLTDARGRLILGFTTLNGWSPLVSDILARTRTVRKRHSELLGRDLPVAQEMIGRRGETLGRIYYFWTQDNPFIPYIDFCDGLRGRPEAEIMARAHGIPTKSSSSPFPAFDEEVHVIKHEDLPWLKPRTSKDGKILPPPKVTRYHVVDPSGSKPWFMIWAAIDAAGVAYVYREWPDIEYGEWAEPSDSPEGKQGPAQKPLGWGYGDYSDLFKEREDGEEIFERIIDPRLGNAQIQGKEGVTTIINDMDSFGYTFIPAPGLGIEHGIAAINDKLAYDPEKPISAMNRPKLLISDKCHQTIYAFKNYAKFGKDDACKDPIDCVRYLLEARCDFVDEQKNEATGTFGY